jgi:hypothetical protein
MTTTHSFPHPYAGRIDNSAHGPISAALTAVTPGRRHVRMESSGTSARPVAGFEPVGISKRRWPSGLCLGRFGDQARDRGRSEGCAAGPRADASRQDDRSRWPAVEPASGTARRPPRPARGRRTEELNQPDQSTPDLHTGQPPSASALNATARPEATRGLLTWPRPGATGPAGASMTDRSYGRGGPYRDV